MKNEKGFTLIEIMVTVILLGVILTIAVPSMLSLMQDKAGELNKEEKKMLIEAARVYVNQHSEEFECSTCTKCIKLEELGGLYAESAKSKYFNSRKEDYISVSITSEKKEYNYAGASCTESN